MESQLDTNKLLSTPTPESAGPSSPPINYIRSMIFGQISKTMADVGAVGKGQRNTAQGYSFRGIDDLYNALQPIMAKHGIFMVPEVISDHTEERTTKSGAALLYRCLKVRYRFYAGDGSYVDAVVMGEGADSGDKASNKAMSAAQKYALIQVFCVPTAEAKDSEFDSHEMARKPAPPPAPQKPNSSRSTW